MSKKYLKKVLSVITLVHLMANIAAPVYAANGDFYDKSSRTYYRASDYSVNPATFMNLLMALRMDDSRFVYEFGNKSYNYKKLMNALLSSTKSTRAEVFAGAISDPWFASIYFSNLVCN